MADDDLTRAREARSQELRAGTEYLKTVNESFGPMGRSAAETGAALAREEARLVLLGNFAAVGFLLNQCAQEGFPAQDAWFGAGVVLLLVGAMISLFSLRSWATSLSHEASANFLTIRREQARISADLYGTLEQNPVTDADINSARADQEKFRGRGYLGMALAGSASIFGYAFILISVEPWLGLR
jgi:hypothetical protein